MTGADRVITAKWRLDALSAGNAAKTQTGEPGSGAEEFFEMHWKWWEFFRKLEGRPAERLEELARPAFGA